MDSMGSIDDIYRDQKKSKTPLYDELSIPFIDASLPPTPKVDKIYSIIGMLCYVHVHQTFRLVEAVIP